MGTGTSATTELKRPLKIVEAEAPSLDAFSLQSPATTRMDDWFKVHGDADEQIRRGVGNGLSVTVMWRWLRKYHDFPFSQPGFYGWVRRQKERA